MSGTSFEKDTMALTVESLGKRIGSGVGWALRTAVTGWTLLRRGVRALVARVTQRTQSKRSTATNKRDEKRRRKEILRQLKQKNFKRAA
jgi:hypothetical protein